MRAVVTGGAGFIGSHLAERLASEGGEVLVIDNLSSGRSRVSTLERAGIDLQTVDIRQEQLLKVIGSHSPEVVFHLAAQSSVPQSVADPVLDAKINVVGMLRVLEAARASGSRVVFASSAGTIYGEVPPERLPAAEDVEGEPVSPYGIAKKVAEYYLRFYRHQFGVPFVSLALANVYGPRQDSTGEAGVVAIFASKLLSGTQCAISGDGEQTRDFVYVPDVVQAFFSAIENGEGQTINIGTSIETSINNLYQAMANITGVDSPAVHGPERAGDVRRNSVDISKAARLLEWHPAVDLSEGLKLTIDSFRSN